LQNIAGQAAGSYMIMSPATFWHHRRYLPEPLGREAFSVNEYDLLPAPDSSYGKLDTDIGLARTEAPYIW